MKKSQKQLIKRLHKQTCYYQEIEQEFPELFPKEELKNDVWYKYKDSDTHLVRFTNVDNCVGYGFNSSGYTKSDVWTTTDLIPAKREYILKTFEKEVKKLYNTPCKVQYLDSGWDNLIGTSLSFDVNKNILYATSGGTDILYQDNEWAKTEDKNEKLKQEIERTKQQLEKLQKELNKS